ncbi:hypothetical protein ACHAW5_008433 [Stephanodiscus triporus]|uniref:Uncharacterized protein n=1 Tax=Stephanodiscus triporus TaxID=2934178 RepID=A0ABD3MG03_9STRA
MAILFAAGLIALSASAFQPPPPRRHGSLSSLMLRTQWSSQQQRSRVLEMAAGDVDNDNDGGGRSISKQRRRKRKKSADGDIVAPAASIVSGGEEENDDEDDKKKSAKAMVQELLAREQMMFDDSDLTSFTPQKLEDDARIAAAARKAGYSVGGDVGVGGGGGGVVVVGGESQLEDLFDSREFLQRKRERQMEEASRDGAIGGGGGGGSAVPTRKKIKRSDVEAFNRLLEMDPIADEDDSYFEDEGIDFISALLGDVEPGVGTDSDESSNKSGKKVQKKTSFLGIGSGPLQVGHFIGALGVVLMAFVEYPGFPLTNLPDPLRASLQGGLATIYLINAVLAVIAAISAPSRNQPALLWGAKTFAVGGIAYDQLMQIPTPEELAERARKEDETLKRTSGRRGRRQK